MNKDFTNLQELLNNNLDINTSIEDVGVEIEIEINEYTSFIYVEKTDKFFVEHLDMSDLDNIDEWRFPFDRKPPYNQLTLSNTVVEPEQFKEFIDFIDSKFYKEENSINE